MDAGEAHHTHDDTGENDAQRNGDAGGPQAHVQKAGSQGAGPGAGAGQGNAHEEQQRHKQSAAAGSALEFAAAPLTFFDAVGEETADIFFVAAPVEDLPGEEVDDGHRQHIADDADHQRAPVVQPHTNGDGHAAPQLDEGNHGNQENQQVFFKHFLLLIQIFTIVP